MRVVEIFKSIDGEGLRAGFPATFIRLEGCNLRCSYCDTKYSYNDTDYKDMSIEQILHEVKQLGLRYITLTGGEPLIHEDVADLIRILTTFDFFVNVETNGSVDISPYLYNNVLITMDYKCPSSGMQFGMNTHNLKILRPSDVLKFVVGCEEDLETCKHIRNCTQAQKFISPVFGKIEPKDIVKYMLDNKMTDCRIQLQLHKYIWNPEERGV